MTMTDEPPSPSGLLETARRIWASVLGLLRTRVELFATELQEEKLRAGTLLVWLAVAVTLCASGLLVAIGAIALFAWRLAGYTGLAGLALALLAAGAATLWGLRRRVLRGPAPFAGTIAEFRKDAACLHDDP